MHSLTFLHPHVRRCERFGIALQPKEQVWGLRQSDDCNGARSGRRPARKPNFALFPGSSDKAQNFIQGCLSKCVVSLGVCAPALLPVHNLTWSAHTICIPFLSFNAVPYERTAARECLPSCMPDSWRILSISRGPFLTVNSSLYD